MFFESFSPILAILIFAVFLLVLINLFYRFMVNQDEASKIKDRVKELGNEMKKYRNDKEKQKELMNEMMRENSKIMRMTLKPMLLSFVVVILLLPFLATTYNDIYVSLNATDVNIDGKIYQLNITDNKLMINEKECNLPCKIQLNTTIKSNWEILKEGDRIKFERIVAMLPFSLPIINDDLGWIAWYLIVSIPFMMIIRKMMGIKV